MNSSNILSKPNKKDSNKENIGFNKKKALNKRKFLLEDSDDEENTSINKEIPLDDSDGVDNDLEENIILLKKKKTLENNHNIEKDTTVKGKSPLDDSDEGDSDIEQNIISMKKNKTILEDSDDENVDDVSIIQSLMNVSSTGKNIKRKSLLENSDSEEEIGTFKNKNKYLKKQVTVMKEKSLLNNSDDNEDCNLETNIISMKRKKIMLEDSDDENVGDISIVNSQLDASDAEKIESDKRKPLENSDSEEDIGALVKKTKYTINDDSE